MASDILLPLAPPGEDGDWTFSLCDSIRRSKAGNRTDSDIEDCLIEELDLTGDDELNYAPQPPLPSVRRNEIILSDGITPSRQSASQHSEHDNITPCSAPPQQSESSRRVGLLPEHLPRESLRQLAELPATIKRFHDGYNTVIEQLALRVHGLEARIDRVAREITQLNDHIHATGPDLADQFSREVEGIRARGRQAIGEGEEASGGLLANHTPVRKRRRSPSSPVAPKRARFVHLTSLEGLRREAEELEVAEKRIAREQMEHERESSKGDLAEEMSSPRLRRGLSENTEMEETTKTTSQLFSPASSSEL